MNPWTNFVDYGLQAPVGLIRCDAHMPPFRHVHKCFLLLQLVPHITSGREYQAPWPPRLNGTTERISGLR